MDEIPAWGTAPDPAGGSATPLRILGRRGTRPSAPGARPQAHLPLVQPLVGVAGRGTVSALALSGGGRLLLVCRNRWTSTESELWDLPAGKRLWLVRERLPGLAGTASISEDGSRCATTGGRRITILGPSNGRLGRFDDISGVSCLALHPLGRFVVAGTESGALHLVPLKGHARRPALAPMEAKVAAVAVDEHGTRVAAGDTWGRVQVIDPLEGTRSIEFEHPGQAGVQSVTFSRDGGTLQTTDTEGVHRLWEGTTGELLGAVVPGREAWRSVADPRGEFVAVLRHYGDVVLRDRATRGPAAELALAGQLSTLVTSADGSHLAGAGADGMILVWPWPWRRAAG